MTAIERLADLKAHLDHLDDILEESKVDVARLRADRTLHNDVLFSLLMACQAIIDLAGEIASRQALRFQDYTEAVRALAQVEGFSDELVDALAPLPAFRNILIHEYTRLDYGLVMNALDGRESLREFLARAAEILQPG